MRRGDFGEAQGGSLKAASFPDMEYSKGGHCDLNHIIKCICRIGPVRQTPRDFTPTAEIDTHVLNRPGNG